LKGVDWAGQTVKGNADDIALKEALANKQIAFQAVPTNTAYPSEKLVKDKLDLKADKADVVSDFIGGIVKLGVPMMPRNCMNCSTHEFTDWISTKPQVQAQDCLML